MNKCENQTEERFNLLERKIAYLEDFINKLQDVTLKQDKTLQSLEYEQRRLQQKIADITENASQNIPDARPPHY